MLDTLEHGISNMPPKTTSYRNVFWATFVLLGSGTGMLSTIFLPNMESSVTEGGGGGGERGILVSYTPDKLMKEGMFVKFFCLPVCGR